MDNREVESLRNLTLAPYIQKATALIGRSRRVGGNQFRHAMATLAILLDYHYTDPVLLKASVIHDLFEDVPGTDPAAIRLIDADGPAVTRLVQEVSRAYDEQKSVFLARLRDHGSERARVLKSADRISNLTDLHETVFPRGFVQRYLNETAQYIYPLALAVNPQMAVEVQDLLGRRRALLVAPPPQETRTTRDTPAP